MNVGLQISLDKSFSKDSYYYELYNKLIHFEPKRILFGTDMRDWNQEKDIKIIQKYNGKKNLMLSDDNDNCFLTVISAGGQEPHRSISIVQDKSVFLPGRQELDEFFSVTEFVAAYLYDEDYDFVQNARTSYMLSSRELSRELLDTIKNTPTRNGIHGIEFNTKFNPGRSDLISYTHLMVGWKMWFGSAFFNLVPRERILSFPYAHEVSELPNGDVYVHLYEEIGEPHKPESIFRQWKWKEWLDYDGLVERFS